MNIINASSPIVKNQAQALLDFIDASPSPWHAVEAVSQQLLAKGYQQLFETNIWQLKPLGKYFVVRGGASIIAFSLGTQPLVETGFRLIGAHTDSPGLRLKPKAAFANSGLVRIGVEVYGGPILATFADRDLSIAGRVMVKNGADIDTHLVKFNQALIRLPNLAIHMNREVNDKGLKFHKQDELPLILGEAEDGIEADQQLMQQLADELKVKTADILTWELNVYDTQKGSFWGANQEFIANSQLDNLASCHAALTALLANKNSVTTNMIALFDHEEVGSESANGASGSFLNDMISRVTAHENLAAAEKLRALANSFFISADMAHAYHPNFSGSYDPHHHVLVNKGVVIKSNCNHRYASNADTAARFMQFCNQANVPYQQYVHRTDLGCGSTIGPIIAAQLGVATVDVGCPMWAMHSLRESAGVLDHHYMICALTQVFNG
ncbi:MAG: M18 family aminopeptidase [Proteobacteria bacterium ST_bin12]|nr:MAG: M18 family aminopeptidase [Proteobacteria bacterium ST_bin12]